MSDDREWLNSRLVFAAQQWNSDPLGARLAEDVIAELARQAERLAAAEAALAEARQQLANHNAAAAARGGDRIRMRAAKPYSPSPPPAPEGTIMGDRHEETARAIAQRWGARAGLDRLREEIAAALRDAREHGRRAGIEEAAAWHDRQTVRVAAAWSLARHVHSESAQMLRALAAPAEPEKGAEHG